MSQQRKQKSNIRITMVGEKFSQGKEIFKGFVLAIFRYLDGNSVNRKVDLF